MRWGRLGRAQWLPLPASAPRDLRRIDEPVPPPAKREQPGVRRRDLAAPELFGRWLARAGHTSPAIEPAARRGRVDADWRECAVAFPPVLAGVQQHVGQRIPHLARRSKHPQVVPIGQHRPPSATGPVGGSGQPGADRFHPAGEIARARGFDEEMGVIALERVVHDPEAPPLACSVQAPPPFAREPGLAQRGDAATDPEHHVTGKAGGERCAAAMGIAGPGSARATGARAAATPSGYGADAEGKLSRSRGHDAILTSSCVTCGHGRATWFAR